MVDKLLEQLNRIQEKFTYCYQFIIKDTAQNNQIEEKHRANFCGGGVQRPAVSGVSPSQHPNTDPDLKLSKPHPLGFLRAPFTGRQMQSLVIGD